MVSKRLKRIRKKLREKNPRAAVPQIVTTPTNDMMSALADRSVYNTNYVSDRKPSRKKLRNMRSKMVNEAENPNASAAMMSRLAYLMSNGNQNDMLNQRIQAVQNNIDNKNLEITYKNQLAALQEREKNMVNEGKHNDMIKIMKRKYRRVRIELRNLRKKQSNRCTLKNLNLNNKR
jgi:uncharacterized membrane-anchored protein YjiN (DUF445 family)